MSVTRKIWLSFIALGILLLGSILWLIGTESGARWVLARTADLLPRELEIGQASGSLLGGLRIRSVRWLGESVRISIDDGYLDINLIPLVFRYLDVNELRVARFEIEIRDTGEPDTTGELPTVDLPIDISIAAAHLRNVSWRSESVTQAADEIVLAGSLFGSDLRITRLQLASPRLQLDLNGSIELAEAYAGRATIDWRWHQTDELRFAGHLELQGDTRRYKLRNSLTAPITLSTSGDISFESGDLLADLTNEWQSLELSIGNRRLRSPAGALRLRGSVDAYEVDIDASAQLDDWPETRIELAGSADVQKIRIVHLRLVNELGDLSANGNASWLPGQSFDLEYALAGLDPSRVSDAVTGLVNLSGKVNGNIEERVPQLDLRIDQMDGNINGYALQGDAIVAWSPANLAITDAHLRLGSNRVEFNSSLGEVFSLDADVDLASIKEVFPDASGAIHGRVVLGGSRQRPDARVEMAGDSLQWGEYSIGAATVGARITRNEPSFAELDLQQIAIGGSLLDAAQFAASGQLEAHDVSVSVNGYESGLKINAKGGFSESRWSGRVASIEIANEALGRWSGRQESALLVSAEAITLSETCLRPQSSPGRACIAGSYGKDSPASLVFSLSDFPLSAVPVDLPADAGMNGFVDARLDLQRREQQLNGSVAVELRQAVFDASYEGETISVSLTDAGGQATITDNRVDSTLRVELAGDAGTANVRLVIQDLANRQSLIDGEGSVLVNDASLFAVFLPGITNPRGKIEGALTVSGTLNQPEFLGQVALTDGAFSVRQAGIEIVDIDVRLSQRDPGRLRLTGSARSGGGRITLQGDTLLGTDSGIRTELILTGENFELARLPEWQVAASPSIRAVFDERTTQINGALGIPTAKITVNEIPETAESPSPDAIVYRAEGTEAYTGRRITIDVTTVLGDDVRFSGFGLTAAVSGAVRLQGGTRDPWVGAGVLELGDGRYKAYGQELEIERGKLVFNGPLSNPQLDIRATRRANDVTAGIQLSGTPSQLRSEVFSEPALSDAEALSYLLTGRPLSSTTSTGEGDVLNNAAFALGLSGAGSVASQVRGELGLETLAVEGGSESGRIVAGKRFGNRLLVEYGYGLIDKLGTLLLRYQLTDRIILESRTGTISNLDVVYSVKKQ